MWHVVGQYDPSTEPGPQWRKPSEEDWLRGPSNVAGPAAWACTIPECHQWDRHELSLQSFDQLWPLACFGLLFLSLRRKAPVSVAFHSLSLQLPGWTHLSYCNRMDSTEYIWRSTKGETSTQCPDPQNKFHTIWQPSFPTPMISFHTPNTWADLGAKVLYTWLEPVTSGLCRLNFIAKEQCLASMHSYDIV